MKNARKMILATLVICLIVPMVTLVPVEARLAPPGDQYDRTAVVNEAWYAMTGVPYTCGGKYYSGYLVSDWNYMASDMSAQEIIAGHFGEYAGWTAYPPENAQTYGYYQQIGRGGQCLFFVNLILYRSEADMQYVNHDSWAELESSPGLIDYAEPGDIIFRPRSMGTPHAAIVVYKNGNTIGLIDSNGPLYGEIIAYWQTSIPNLNNAGYKVYTGVDYYYY